MPWHSLTCMQTPWKIYSRARSLTHSIETTDEKRWSLFLIYLFIYLYAHRATNCARALRLFLFSRWHDNMMCARDQLKSLKVALTLSPSRCVNVCALFSLSLRGHNLSFRYIFKSSYWKQDHAPNAWCDTLYGTVCIPLTYRCSPESVVH